MKIKKYIASTMPEAMNQIRSDLGSEAVILNSKEISQGGILGLFQKKKLEVVVGIDSKQVTPLTNHSTSNMESTFQEPADPKDNDRLDVLNEIKYVKKLLVQQVNQSKHSHYLPDYQLVYQYLLDQEINKELATKIVDAVIKKHHDKKLEVLTPELVIHDIQLEIEKRLTSTFFPNKSKETKVIHFVGPTGVGKTTTLAKIAAKSILHEGKKVALITSDTYRIAAIEQIKTYAHILDVPIEVVYTIDDYDRAMNKFSAYDLILVDTAGRNFRDETYVKELHRSVNFDMKTYLVLSLTAKPKDIIDIHAQFESFPIKEVIFTKLDETLQFGSMLNITLNNKIKIAYITNGQDVPNDLIQPTSKSISQYIVGGYLDE